MSVKGLRRESLLCRVRSGRAGDRKGDGPLTIIQGDVNGDGKANFSIALVGTLTFTGADFDL
jgi:hypothetical protein